VKSGENATKKERKTADDDDVGRRAVGIEAKRSLFGLLKRQTGKEDESDTNGDRIKIMREVAV
jgi:hypothetical protein